MACSRSTCCGEACVVVTTNGKSDIALATCRCCLSNYMEPVRLKATEVAKERLIDGQDTNKVLLLYTGGTIGMHETPRGLAPLAGYLEDYMMHNPQLHDRTLDAPVDSSGLRTLITPLSRFGRRTRYQIIEYAQLLDSCNMGIPQWLQIARDVERYYDAYDAFVVIHGTDTMAYSAAVCSFLLHNLSKCVIFTGSQVPLCQSHNDGKENLLGAITIAGHLDIPEVCLYFNGKLMRGNRAKKVDCSDFDAFNSPNMSPIATLGVKLTVNWELVISKPVSAELHVQPSICPHVVCLRLYPGISHQLVENLMREPTMGVVIETYGAGKRISNLCVSVAHQVNLQATALTKTLSFCAFAKKPPIVGLSYAMSHSAGAGRWRHIMQQAPLCSTAASYLCMT